MANTILSFITVTLLGDCKVLCKKFSLRKYESMFTFEQTIFILNAIENAGGNKVCHCDEND